MVHYIAPNEIGELLRPTTRKEALTIHVMSFGVIADNVEDFDSFMRRLPANATLISKEEGWSISGRFPIKKARMMFRSARKFGVAKIGGRISAEKRKADSKFGADKIRDRWGMPSTTWPTRVLLAEADLSLNTVKAHLGSRIIAQHNYQAAQKRKARKEGKHG